jgi:transposase-like protein
MAKAIGGARRESVSRAGQPTEQELARLRREVAVLRQEREILKKAVNIFSQQQP